MPATNSEPDLQLAPDGAADEVEQRAVLSGISWEQFLQFDAALGDVPRRTKFLGNRYEIMAPTSLRHERLKHNIACMIEAYCDHLGIVHDNLGAHTLSKPGERAGEPDESFAFAEDRTIPDLVLEIALSSGGIDKLAFYAGFQIPELWIWQRNGLHVYVWSETAGYTRATKSAVLPGIDLYLVEKLAESKSTSRAKRDFLDALREEKSER